MSDNDYFPTPEPLALAMLQLLLTHTKEDPLTVLEPSAGSGSFVKAAEVYAPAVTAVEPFQKKPSIFRGKKNIFWKKQTLEKFAEKAEHKFDVIVGNPPFSFAESHVRLSLGLLAKKGLLGFLLRLSFLESKKRVPLFREFPPRYIYVLTSRPSFMWTWHCKGCKHKWYVEPKNVQTECPECKGEDLYKTTSDSSAYAFFIWEEGYKGKPELGWLETEK